MAVDSVIMITVVPDMKITPSGKVPSKDSHWDYDFSISILGVGTYCKQKGVT